jgi:2-dehydro-3-deoxygalactonokinase
MSLPYAVVGDWGTTRMRLFRISGGAVVDRADGPGIGALTGAPADALRAAIAPWRAIGEPGRILLCGMAGARGIGLAEAPYAECPADAATWARTARHIAVDGIPVAIAAGMACGDDPSRPDVMRGEETQAFGALRLQPGLAEGARLFALPGTHSKWVRLRDGGIRDFHTFPTGELYALLREHSTLVRAGDDDGDEEAGFETGLARARDASGLLGALFLARSAQLRAGRSRGWALGYLSGLLIGSEVGEALGQNNASVDAPVVLIGAPALTARYARALQDHGVASEALDGEACALAGLRLFEERLLREGLA